MFEAKITIACPDFALAASALAAAINHRMLPAESKVPTPAAAPTQAQPPMPAPAPVTVPPAPTYAAQTNSPVYRPAPAPVAAPPAPYPTAASTFTPAIPAAAPAAAPTSAPTYTRDQLTKAGADLAQAGKMQQLMGLLQQFGIQAITQLPPEQYGAMATALRGLGAQL